MIIDTHIHIGSYGRFFKSKQKVLESVAKYHIDFGLISSCDAVEYTPKGNNLPFFLKMIFIAKKAMQIATINIVMRIVSIILLIFAAKILQ